MTFQAMMQWSWLLLGLEHESERHRRSLTPPPNPIERARRYEKALNVPGASYATVGKQFGVSRIEVCHYVTVVRRLPVRALLVVERETDAGRLRALSLRRLLAISRMNTQKLKQSAFKRLEASLPPLRLHDREVAPL